MSALVWSVESAVLGAWALIFSFYSTPFHEFVARSHSLIAAFTLLVQLVCTARDLPPSIAHGVSEAFLCAVTALALVYAAGVLDRSNHDRFFRMPSAGGLVPLDAAIGTAWFCAALTSAMGMALSGVKGSSGGGGGGRQRTSLMFHPYGYHAWIVLPSFLMLWLYNYDGANREDPVNKGIRFIQNNDVTITHTLIFIVYAGIWGVFVTALLLGEGVLSMGREWIAWRRMSTGRHVAYLLSVFVKLIGRCGCVVIPLSAVFVARTQAQMIMAWVFTGVAGAFAMDLLGWVDKLLAGRGDDQQPSSINAPPSTGEENEGDYVSSEFYAPRALQPPSASIPIEHALRSEENIVPTAPSISMMQAGKMFNHHQQAIHRHPPSHQQNDPAAVAMVAGGGSGAANARREKIV